MIYHLADALGPLWRAWDRLTGRSTLALSWLLFGAGLSWSFVYAVAGRRFFTIFFVVVLGPAIATHLRTLQRHQDEPSETIPVDVLATHAFLRWWGAVLIFIFLLDVATFHASRDYDGLGRDVLYTLGCAAALANQPGSGQSVVRRVLDGLLRLAPAR